MHAFENSCQKNRTSAVLTCRRCPTCSWDWIRINGSWTTPYLPDFQSTITAVERNVPRHAIAYSCNTLCSHSTFHKQKTTCSHRTNGWGCVTVCFRIRWWLGLRSPTLVGWYFPLSHCATSKSFHAWGTYRTALLGASRIVLEWTRLGPALKTPQHEVFLYDCHFCFLYLVF